jgi:hypothetical protein
MFRFLLLKVPHVQFFVIIKVMLDSILIVYEKKYVQVFVIKSTPCSIFFIIKVMLHLALIVCMRKNMFNFLLLKVSHVQFLLL